jgi:hypothetical protein
MIWAAVPVRGIPMTGENNRGLQLLHPCGGRLKVCHFEPEEHTVPRRKGGVPDRAVMVSDVPPMELEDESLARH